jgi:exosortase
MEAAVSGVVQTELPRTSHAEARLPELSVWQIAVLAGLILWLYGPTIFHLAEQWWDDPNFSHGFLVPIFSIFVVWRDRSRLTRMTPSPSSTGLLILTAAMLLLVIGQMGAELFLARFSLLLVVAGLIVLFLGWTIFRAVLFPWAFLILMIPIPAILYNQITFPLQLLASRVAAAVLALIGIPVLREGNVINLPNLSLEVAEACSGVRFLVSLIALAIIYGFITETRSWMRYLLAVASVPIAVIANSIRIIGTGLLVQHWNAEAAQGFFHASWGWMIFVISLLMLYAFHQLMRSVWADRSTIP